MTTTDWRRAENTREPLIIPSPTYTTRYRVRWQFGNSLMREKWFTEDGVTPAVVRATRFGKQRVLDGADVVSVIPITGAVTRREERLLA